MILIVYFSKVRELKNEELFKNNDLKYEKLE